MTKLAPFIVAENEARVAPVYNVPYSVLYAVVPSVITDSCVVWYAVPEVIDTI
jgi:hypothetical protein